MELWVNIIQIIALYFIIIFIKYYLIQEYNVILFLLVYNKYMKC